MIGVRRKVSQKKGKGEKMATHATRLETGRRLFDVAEYHCMGDIGILDKDEGVELLDGRLFQKHTGAPRLFTVDEYRKLAEAGILGEDERIELIEGEITEMAPVGIAHASCVDRLTELLVHSLSRQAIVRVQSPIYLGKRIEPEPDLTLLKPSDYSRAKQHPGPDDIFLLIEVSDTMLTTDQQVKIPLYAAAGIPEVWIVNLPESVIKVYSSPSRQEYQQVRTARHGETLQVPGVAAITVPVDEILP